MNKIRPVSEEFMYCDPESINDQHEFNENNHPCHFCYVVEKLAASDEEIRRLHHEQQ